MHANQAWNKQLRHQRKIRNWTLAELASQLACDPKTVSRWEQDDTYPSPYLRRKLTELLDISFEVEQAEIIPLPSQKEDWGEAPAVDHFFGREADLALMRLWIEEDHCRVIAITGLGGIGKTTFATLVAQQVAPHFERVWWHSLQNAPTVEQLLTTCLRFLLGNQQREIPQELDQQVTVLLEILRKQRCLLILDNADSLLQAGQSAGQYQAAHQDYARVVQMLGATQHRSCLLLTNREKSHEIARLEGRTSPVRVLALNGLSSDHCRDILQDQQLQGSQEDWDALTQLYRGNPLALKLVAEPIGAVFQGQIASFLAAGASVFGDINKLLEQHFSRLSPLELEIVYWLASEREETSLEVLQADIQRPLARGAVLEALDSLRRRSLVEVGKTGRFLLQPVILEEATSRFIERITQEFARAEIGLLGTHALLKARAKNYIRQAQERFVLTPVADQILQTDGRTEIARRINEMLKTIRALQRPDYAAGNLLNLLLHLSLDIRGYDFSSLYIKEAYLQNQAVTEVNFTDATFMQTVFTQTFSSLQCVAIRSDGQVLAAGTTTGEIWFWNLPDLTSPTTCLGHVDGLRTLAFSDDGRWLASGGEDTLIRIWDAQKRVCIASLAGHNDIIRSLAFSPDGLQLASASEDTTVRLWDIISGQCITTLEGHTRRVRAVTFDTSGEYLFSAGDDPQILLWLTANGRLLTKLPATHSQTMTLAFDASRQLLASGHEDSQIRLWPLATFLDKNRRELPTGPARLLRGHNSRVRTMTIDPNGQFLVSGSDDQRITLWDIETGQMLSVLQGHSSRVWSVAITPDARRMVSVSEDETLRVWDTQSGACHQVLRGSISLLKALAFSPDGQLLISGSEDLRLCIWDVRNQQLLRTLHGHTHRIRSVAFSPDGVTIASGSEDESVRLWNAHTGKCLHVLQGHTHLVRAVAFSPDGQWLASAGYDGGIRLWEVASGYCLHTWSAEQGFIWGLAFSPDGSLLASAGEDHTVRTWLPPAGQLAQSFAGHKHRVWSVAFSPDGQTLVSSGDDRTVRLWDTTTGRCLRVLSEHRHWVRDVAFSPLGDRIASASHDQTVRIWHADNGTCLHTFTYHTSGVWAVTFSPDGQTLASCGDDSTIRLWDTESGRSTFLLRNDGPYERMNITNVRGLSASQIISLKLLGAIED